VCLPIVSFPENALNCESSVQNSTLANCLSTKLVKAVVLQPSLQREKSNRRRSHHEGQLANSFSRRCWNSVLLLLLLPEIHRTAFDARWVGMPYFPSVDYNAKKPQKTESKKRVSLDWPRRKRKETRTPLTRLIYSTALERRIWWNGLTNYVQLTSRKYDSVQTIEADATSLEDRNFT